MAAVGLVTVIDVCEYKQAHCGQKQSFAGVLQFSIPAPRKEAI